MSVLHFYIYYFLFHYFFSADCDGNETIKEANIYYIHQDDHFSIKCSSNMALSGDKYTHLVWTKILGNKSKEELNAKTLIDIHMNHTIWDVEELSFQNFSRSNAGLYACTNTKCNKSVVIKLVMIGTKILFCY